MRVYINISFSLIFSLNVLGQTKEIDSLRNVVKDSAIPKIDRQKAIVIIADRFAERLSMDSAMSYSLNMLQFLPDLSDPSTIDSIEIEHLIRLGGTYQFFKLDSAILFSTKAVEAAKHKQFQNLEGRASRSLGENFRLNGDLLRALENMFNGLRISRHIQDRELEAECLIFIGIAYSDLGEDRMGLNYLLPGLVYEKYISFRAMVPFALTNVGKAYQNLDILDSARYYHESAESMTSSMKLNHTPLHSDISIGLGKLYFSLNKPEQAVGFFRKVINNGDYLNLAVAQYWMGELYYSLGKTDSSMYYARLSFINAEQSLQKIGVMDAAERLSILFSKQNMNDSAYHYQSIVLMLRDSLYSSQNFKKLQLAAVTEQQIHYENLQKKEQAEQEKKELANKFKVYGLIAVLVLLTLIVFVQLRNNRTKQKANALLQAQKDEAGLQREKAEVALRELEATQSQLIQSEKMASLGELTAGIAHEIQNPLNFVNNFSDVNKELAEELEQEAEKGNLKEVQLLARDIKDNEIKINHHGKRADAIVKNMLQHSRAAAGVKEPTNINALADEYLRLAYHGLRAKDKLFNTDLQINLDNSLGLVSIIPQDIGRVFLNLFNNAFYAVHKKSTTGSEYYKPVVSLRTERKGSEVVITVTDNGDGIPEEIKDKIFQPFFTTKPTGEGTGLGLSLSYDIIKAHGGKLMVKSEVGKGSEFSISLPL